MTGKKRIISLLLSLAIVFAAAGYQTCHVFASGRSLNVAQARSMAMAGSKSYKKLKNKLILAQVKYQEAVKSIRLKKKNMATFRWTPLLSFKFPEKPDLAEAFEFTYKPLQIQSEINSIKHEMSVVKYDVCESVGNKFTEVYTYQETITFYEEQLASGEETLRRNQARLLVGEANVSDIEAIEKSLNSIRNKLAGVMRNFEKTKKKLGEMIGLDVSSGYEFRNPYVETGMTRSDLDKIRQSALDQDHTYYEAKVNTQLQRISMDTNYSLMRGQYGQKMNRLDPFINAARNGGKTDSDALKAEYDKMLEDVDAPWQGNIKILFIKIPKEWFKGQISGVRYVEDEPYTLYTNILEYQEAAADEADAKKELLDSVEDAYDNAVTAKNAYETMKKEVESLKKDVDAGLLLNKAGSLPFDELKSMQELYEENQMTLLETLSTYTQSLYTLDSISCGAVTSLLYAAGTNMEAVSGGDSLVTEETAEGARYYITTSVEDNIFEVGIYIPEDYSLEVTSFELWIDGIQIGERTEADKKIRHLALDKDNAEKAVIRLYNGDTFVDDCQINPLEYEGPLEVTGGYVPDKKEELVVAEYQTETGANGLMSIVIRPTKEGGSPAYYTVENQKGKQLYGEDLIPIGEPFTYLSLLNGELRELRVRFYNRSQGELYTAEFDTAKLKLIKEEP